MSAKQVTLVEVGPRDGLQNEKKIVSVDAKAKFVRDLVAAGVSEIEVGAFVRPDRVPQMADSEKLLKKLASLRKLRPWSLVPNERGLDRAIETGVKRIAIFTAATNGFNRANIGMSVAESIKVFRRISKRAQDEGMEVRGYVSTSFGCPYDGKVQPTFPLRVAEHLAEMGVTQVSFGDTIGVATPKDIEGVIKPAIKRFGARRVALHLHDTRGTAIANALAGYNLGCRTFDTSAGGLGGCPFAPGATGNLATEDLVYMFDGMKVKTGIDLKKLSEASLSLAKKMNRPIASRYLNAYVAQKKRKPAKSPAKKSRSGRGKVGSRIR